MPIKKYKMESNKEASSLVLVYYRDWASEVANEFDSKAMLINSKENWDLHTFSPNNHYIFIGWSWIIPDNYIRNGNCFCIHPSDLPKFRGGSPIQNQVIAGVTNSFVSLFQMNDGLDSGPIFAKVPISLEGYLDEIFLNIIGASIKLISMFNRALLQDQDLLLKGQNLEDGFVCKRRKPEDSIIAVKDLEKYSPKQLYNMVRCLQEPYPELMIEYPDGAKLILTRVSYVE